MSREIFFNGHFFYGHRLGRYFRPDDLALTVLKKGASWAPFFTRCFRWLSLPMPAEARQHGTLI